MFRNGKLGDLMKLMCVLILLATGAASSYAADVYEFGQDQGSSTHDVRVQKESGYKTAPATSESDVSEAVASGEQALQEEADSLSGCEQSTKVGGYVVKTENNCDQDGKPLIRFGK